MIGIIFFIFGLIIGSFLNVVVYRINTADTLLGRSYCPLCKKGIKWYDNIPLLSFIILGARCRYCRKKISWQYPLVEALTGLLFLFIGIQFFSPYDSATWIFTFYYLVIFAFLVVILVYDWLYMEIPGVALWPSIGFVVALNLIIDWQKSDFSHGILGISTYSGMVAAFLSFLFFFLLVAISKEKWMGIGDAYLVILLGLVLGWPQILLALFLAFLSGSVVGLVLIAIHRKKIKSQLPFAPFLIFGTIVTIFFYLPIISWYAGLFYF